MFFQLARTVRVVNTEDNSPPFRFQTSNEKSNVQHALGHCRGIKPPCRSSAKPLDKEMMTTKKRLFIIIFIYCLIVSGCSKDTPIATTFNLPKGSEITLQSALSTLHPDKELIFELSGIPNSKNDRDFSDYLSVTLTDVSGKTYRPEKIQDINGSRRDIIAICNNIPKGTKIISVQIIALQDLKGTGIRWWNGKLL